MAAEERDEWERLMDEDGPPNEMDEQQQRYDSEEEWEQRLREEAGMPLEKAYEEWGWSWCRSLCPNSFDTHWHHLYSAIAVRYLARRNTLTLPLNISHAVPALRT